MSANRLVPLTGVLAVVLIVVAVVVGGETPDTDASVQKVVSFYTENDSDQVASGILVAFGTFFFLCFATVLRKALRRLEVEAAGASALSFAGAIVLAVGLLIFAGLSVALGEAPEKLDPSALQALHVLNNDLFFPAAVGAMAFLIGTGIAVVRTGALPRWLGWVAIVAGVLSATPIFFVSIFALALWILIVSVLLSLGAEADSGVGRAPPPAV
jgi:uncharacterized protein DUF4386